MKLEHALRVICLTALSVAQAACATPPDRVGGLPVSTVSAPPGFAPSIRTFTLDRNALTQPTLSDVQRTLDAASDGTVDVLALSGGGAGGAYGAGVLVGLSEAGQRPSYEIVTGVSTGALIAPFAFLGPDWNDELTAAYAGGASENLLRSRGVHALFGTAFFQGRPLRALVESFVTEELIEALALEASTGRLLLVATTNLDHEETVIWDLGAIASQGGPHARTLVTNVLVASASVPGVFPPVMLDVVNGGRTTQEMHVDGGASTPFFVAPEVMLTLRQQPERLRGANVYVISNAQLAVPQRLTAQNTVSIARRSYSSAMMHMTRTALSRTRVLAESHGMTFQFTSISPGYPYRGSLAFDRADMSALFEYGRRCAAQGNVWVTEFALDRHRTDVQQSVSAPCPTMAAN